MSREKALATNRTAELELSDKGCGIKGSVGCLLCSVVNIYQRDGY